MNIFTLQTNILRVVIMVVVYIQLIVSLIVYIFSSLITFSRDINMRDRSMVFMAPKSGLDIILSKFSTTMVLGLLLAFVSGSIFLLNMIFVYPDGIKHLIPELQKLDYSPIVLGVLSFGSFFSLVYLSIIITKTFLSKLKFKTFITIIVMAVLSKLFNLLIWNFLKDFSGLGISIIGTIVVTGIMLWISGWLVDNKTDF